MRLYTFLREGWSSLDASVFVDNFHLGMLCEALEAVFAGQIPRLCINVPPSTSKSRVVSIAFPAWCWTRSPQEKILSASNTYELARDMSSASRSLMESPWFRSKFGDVLAHGGGAGDYYSIAGGRRAAAGIESFITGSHWGVHLIDDPSAPGETNPEAFKKIIQWKKTKLDTRRVDARSTRQVLIMQRLHDLDLSAYCIEKEGFWALRLPMRVTYSIAGLA